MIRTQEQYIQEYMKRRALWMHDGNLKRPHVKLRSGLHSNGFFNSRPIIDDEALLEQCTSDLLEKFDMAGGEAMLVEGVVGPQTGATKMAKFLARHLERIAHQPCFYASPAKQEKDGESVMVFDPRERALLPNASILLCEDVVTTAGSLERTANAIKEAGGLLLDHVLVLVNRSGMKDWKGRKIISLIEKDLPQWEAEKCLLCPHGSEAIADPKDHWDTLTGSY